MIRVGSKVNYQNKTGTVVSIEDRVIAVVKMDYTNEIVSIPLNELLNSLSEGVRSSSGTTRILRS